MNIKYTSGLLICVLAGSVVLISCGGAPGGKSLTAHRDHVIDLSLNSNSTKLMIDTKPIGNCRASQRKDGCVVVGRRETAMIRFKLNTSKAWYFKELRICAGADESATCGLMKWQRTEFSAFLRNRRSEVFLDANGVIEMSRLSKNNGVRKFNVFDYNSTEQDYFYTIKACRMRDEKEYCVDTDPLIQNKGKL